MKTVGYAAKRRRTPQLQRSSTVLWEDRGEKIGKYMVVETSAELRAALVIYSEIERSLVGIGKEADPARRLELVRWRRKLAEQTGVVGTLIERDPLLARHPEKQREMSALFSAFRFAFCQHQANWPVVQTDGKRAEYVASARETYGKSEVFWRWCAANLAFERH
jgi:hypothetical protein